jgi:hypothetical protein
MRFFIKSEMSDPTTNFDEHQLAERALSMQALRTDVEGGGGNSMRNAK